MKRNKRKVGNRIMAISETSQKIYEGISNILKENGQQLSKSQSYAIESMIGAIEESTEKRCSELTEEIIAKKDMIANNGHDEIVDEETETNMMEKVNEIVDGRVRELKKELPSVIDYAKLKKLQECVDAIKECVGYNSDEQLQKVASNNAKMLHSTKNLLETQAKTISEKTASLNESKAKINQLNEQIKQMQCKIDAKDKQIVESINKTKELANNIKVLESKIVESKKINESIEQKRKDESLKYYLETKIAQYPKYEASLLRKHFQNAKSRAEIDENFSKALSIVGEKRDNMRNVQPIPVAKAVNESETSRKGISGGETIVKESGGNAVISDSMYDDDSFVDIDNEVITP